MRILIIEDEAEIVRFLKLELQHEGYEVKSCMDGRSGLDAALAEAFDLVLLDVMLPELNGVEVLRRLRREKQTPVIMVTARDAVTEKVNGETKTFADGALNLTDFDGQNIWQTWSFGPALLTESGEKISEFNSDLNDRHPRCGVGYYAPGHYCFIVVDGRQKGYSIGVRLSEFSSLFANLGCKQAYNLDGGATAIMMFKGEVINKPYKGGRESGDIIYFK